MWFPIILWLGCLTCMVMQLVLMIVNLHNPNFGPYRWATVDMATGPGIVLIPMLVMSILLNIYCTGKFCGWKLKTNTD